MAKIYVQSFKIAWASTASMAAAGCQTSGSFSTLGYARIIGSVISNASFKGGSGFRFSQSLDGGLNYDFHSDFAPTACSGSAFSIEVIGDAAKIDAITDSAASLFRAGFWLRPI